MSDMKTCDCERSNYRVVHRNHNHSYFEYPKGGQHYSNYSGIVCMRCSRRFRTKAKWVLECPDVGAEEAGKIDRDEFPEHLNISNMSVSDYSGRER